MDEKQYLKAREVAKRLNISVMTLYRMRQRGEFIHGIFFSPHCLRWSVDAVDEWVRSKNATQNI